MFVVVIPPLMFGLSPNITGSFGHLLTNEVLDRMGSADGVFSTGTSLYGVVESATVSKRGTDAVDGIKLDLSTGSSLFSSSKLQVPALQVLACIRI